MSLTSREPFALPDPQMLMRVGLDLLFNYHPTEEHTKVASALFDIATIIEQSDPDKLQAEWALRLSDAHLLARRLTAQDLFYMAPELTVRQIAEKLAVDFGGDVDSIEKDVRRQKKNGHLVTYPSPINPKRRKGRPRSSARTK